mgnify:CR=1 FL=1
MILLQDTEIDVQGLFENKEYEFRVAAVNENGEGDFLQGDNSIIAKLPFGKDIVQLLNFKI